jgi:hypothetical protein
MQGPEHGLEIAVLVRGGDHLLEKAFCEKYKVRLVDVPVEDPRMLPFAARNLFADVRNTYDLFVYSEDDLRPADGSLASKVAAFVETFGWRRLVLPNRYEWNPAGLTLKTFIDGDLKPAVTGPYFQALPDEPFLRMKLPGREVRFQRALNPHSGFFALTTEQLAYWMAQQHFDERDCSFIGPLESAATLGALKTFPIYKPFARDAGWLEIQHLDQRFSTPSNRKATDKAADKAQGAEEPPAEPEKR